MATTELYTYRDAVEHLLDWFGTGTTDEMTLRKCKRSIENAYRQLASIRQWGYYFGRASLDTVAKYDTGTIVYDHTGGASERMVTLTTGTWPTWTKFGVLRIGNIDYEIATRESNSVITLSVNSNPGEDVASTDYLLYRDTYPCPVNFLSIGTIRDADNAFWPQYVPPNEMVASRVVGNSPTFPQMYTIASDQNYIGSLAFKFYPPPDAVYHYDYMYIRRPRQMSIYQYNAGTVSTSSTTVTGVGTAFTASMIGSVIRFSVNGTLAPTGTTGSNPYVEQRVIVSYTSATSIELDQALSSAASAVKYEISDPVDLEAGAMYTAFLRRCECEMAMMMNRDDVNRLTQQSQMAERLAMESDSRHAVPMGGTAWRRVPTTWEVTQDSS